MAAVTWVAAVITLLVQKGITCQDRKMCEFEAGPNPVEQELTGEQIGALLSYFGIDLSDNLESLQQGVVTLAQMQRA